MTMFALWTESVGLATVAFVSYAKDWGLLYGERGTR